MIITCMHSRHFYFMLLLWPVERWPIPDDRSSVPAALPFSWFIWWLIYFFSYAFGSISMERNKGEESFPGRTLQAECCAIMSEYAQHSANVRAAEPASTVLVFVVFFFSWKWTFLLTMDRRVAKITPHCIRHQWFDQWDMFPYTLNVKTSILLHHKAHSSAGDKFSS